MILIPSPIATKQEVVAKCILDLDHYSQYLCHSISNIQEFVAVNHMVTTILLVVIMVAIITIA
jgi:hypothetical protein